MANRAVYNLTQLIEHPWRLLGFLVALVLLAYVNVIVDLIAVWWASPEYGFGLLIPFVIAYILYHKRDSLVSGDLTGSWLAVGMLVFAQLISLSAHLADIEAVKRYALLISLAAAVMAVGGWTLLRRFAIAFLLLLFALPLPYLLGAIITTKMQLISSDFGVWMLRLLGLVVHQDGNVITMDGFTMLVAEACSGLRYLYPLMAIALIIAYFFKGRFWHRVLIFLLAVPITIVMNSLRIAMTGVLIKHFGVQAAEGFLHDFEGWLVFATAFVFLLCAVWVLVWVINRFAVERKPFHKYFDLMLDADLRASKQSAARPYAVPLGLVIAFSGLAIVSAVMTYVIVLNQKETIPERRTFEDFPFHLAGREIYPELLSRQILDVLKADDYFAADYKKANFDDINLYIAYYASQKEGSALHSPRACLPGGGWRIQGIETVDLARFGSTGKANRVVIEQGLHQLLVYYWIHQQGENYANEFKARFMLLKGSVMRGRTDGALIRVISPVVEGDLATAEQNVEEFIRALTPVLPNYLPE